MKLKKIIKNAKTKKLSNPLINPSTLKS